MPLTSRTDTADMEVGKMGLFSRRTGKDEALLEEHQWEVMPQQSMQAAAQIFATVGRPMPNVVKAVGVDLRQRSSALPFSHDLAGYTAHVWETGDRQRPYATLVLDPRSQGESITVAERSRGGHVTVRVHARDGSNVIVGELACRSVSEWARPTLDMAQQATALSVQRQRDAAASTSADGATGAPLVADGYPVLLSDFLWRTRNVPAIRGWDVLESWPFPSAGGGARVELWGHLQDDHPAAMAGRPMRTTRWIGAAFSDDETIDSLLAVEVLHDDSLHLVRYDDRGRADLGRNHRLWEPTEFAWTAFITLRPDRPLSPPSGSGRVLGPLFIHEPPVPIAAPPDWRIQSGMSAKPADRSALMILNEWPAPPELSLDRLAAQNLDTERIDNEVFDVLHIDNRPNGQPVIVQEYRWAGESLDIPQVRVDAFARIPDGHAFRAWFECDEHNADQYRPVVWQEMVPRLAAALTATCQQGPYLSSSLPATPPAPPLVLHSSTLSLPTPLTWEGSAETSATSPDGKSTFRVRTTSIGDHVSLDDFVKDDFHQRGRIGHKREHLQPAVHVAQDRVVVSCVRTPGDDDDIIEHCAYAISEDSRRRRRGHTARFTTSASNASAVEAVREAMMGQMIWKFAALSAVSSIG